MLMLRQAPPASQSVVSMSTSVSPVTTELLLWTFRIKNVMKPKRPRYNSQQLHHKVRNRRDADEWTWRIWRPTPPLLIFSWMRWIEWSLANFILIDVGTDQIFSTANNALCAGGSLNQPGIKLFQKLKRWLFSAVLWPFFKVFETCY